MNIMSYYGVDGDFDSSHMDEVVFNNVGPIMHILLDY